MRRPRLALTLGDVAGIGPEVVARALTNDNVRAEVDSLVIGHPEILRRTLRLIGVEREVVEVSTPAAARIDSPGPSPPQPIACWNPAGDAALDVPAGALDARAGRTAYDCLIAAIRAARGGTIDGIVTAPLSKAALHLAGLNYPGHTEILAEECGVGEFAMMLYLPPGADQSRLSLRERATGELAIRSPYGLGVAHVTLHTSLRSVPDLISTPAIEEKIALVDNFLRQLGCDSPRIGICALNPHAGEDGLFGDEESRLIAPAVAAAQRAGIQASGPFPADTLLKRAVAGEFDGVVAMYHDQGHIALKLIGFDAAVNVTLGLPIIRTSPSHGTAFDIAWKGIARGEGMRQAIQVAGRLAMSRSS